MSGRVVGWYHRLPSPLQGIFASGKGAALRWWRYGRDTERLVAEAAERESWTAERWARWQEEELARTLHRAATRVPFYRAGWQERRRGGDRSPWEVLGNWPVLDKSTVRKAPRAFLEDGSVPALMFHTHTSGTTGTPLSLWWSRADYRRWYALFERRWRNWYGVSRRDRWAILGGQLVIPQGRAKPPYWVWNGPMRQLYLSSYHLSPGTAGEYLRAMRGHGVRYLWGYPSAMNSLARFALAAGLSGPRLQVAVSNAEPLFPYQRSAIGELFGCPVRDTYGMAEAVAAASECPEGGRLHLWPDAGVVEAVGPDGAPVPPGEKGELACTGLVNRRMPLVRYRNGDLGKLAPAGEKGCACSRSFPVLESVEGRADDLIVTPGGREVGRMDPVFKADLRVREAQIVQTASDRLLVQIVPEAGFGEKDLAGIVEAVRERTGGMQVETRLVSGIPRDANGKFRAVVNLAKGR